MVSDFFDPIARDIATDPMGTGLWPTKKSCLPNTNALRPEYRQLKTPKIRHHNVALSDSHLSNLITTETFKYITLVHEYAYDT